MAIHSQAFADTARRIYEKQIPYKFGGKDLRGMDSGGFIEYCLKQHGVSCSFSGTNDLYRKIGDERIPLKQAIREKKVVPGALLLHVADDGGEPDRYNDDEVETTIKWLRIEYYLSLGIKVNKELEKLIAEVTDDDIH